MGAFEENMDFSSFPYSDYCTAFYVPEESAVMIYDEIQEDALLTIPAATEAEAASIMFQWRMNKPKGCICFTMI